MKKLERIYEETKAWLCYIFTAKPTWISIGIGAVLIVAALIIASNI